AERRARGRADAEAAHQRLRAVMSGADADAGAVGELGDVVRVDAVDRERRERAATLGVAWPDDPQPGNLGQPLEHVCGERALVIAHTLHTERVEVADGRTEPDRLGDRRRSRLELVWQLVPRD